MSNLTHFLFVYTDKLKHDITRPETRDRLRFISSDEFGMDEPAKTPDDNTFLATFRKLTLD